MKPAYRTIEYIVYPPDWVRGDGRHKRVKNKKAAMRVCRQMGIGAEMWRKFDKRNRKGGGASWMDQRPWIYLGAHPRNSLLPQKSPQGER